MIYCYYLVYTVTYNFGQPGIKLLKFKLSSIFFMFVLLFMNLFWVYKIIGVFFSTYLSKTNIFLIKNAKIEMLKEPLITSSDNNSPKKRSRSSKKI